MTIHLGNPSTKEVRRLSLDRNLAMTLAATEYDRVVTTLENLRPGEWTLDTDCPAWDVRAMAGHMLGMAQMVASMPQLVRQQATSQRAAKKNDTVPIDELTALQVVKNASLSHDQVVQQMRHLGPRATRVRRRLTRILGNRTMPEPQTIGGIPERWTFGFLFGVILTRDPFMHRLDISRATGSPMPATADHEGVLVDDVVREWATRHGQTCHLELTGPAGGTWSFGEGEGDRMTMDAFEFCRAVGGRAQVTGLLAEQVPF
jgi:uncharacterized protein (TIGR03083 family)